MKCLFFPAVWITLMLAAVAVLETPLAKHPLPDEPAAEQQPKDDCIQVGYAIGGSDILVGGHFNKKSSWELCQVSCAAITECQAWTWIGSGSSQNYCLLKYKHDTILPMENAVSGFRNC